MPRLSEHERSGAIGMLKAGVRVSGVTRYHNCHPSTKQRLRDHYQATGTVKDRRRSGQPRMATAVGLNNIYSDKVHDIHKYNVKIVGSDSKPVAYLDHLLDML